MKHTMGSRLLSLLLTLAMLVTLAPAALAAEDEGGPEPTYTLTGVSITPPNVTMQVGDSQTLTATVTISGKEYNATKDLPEGCSLDVEWSVSNDRTSEVQLSPDSSNVLACTVKALKPAETTITEPLTVKISVTLNGEGIPETGTCEVKINSAEQNGLTLYPTTLELPPMGSGMINATVTPATASQTVEWESQDETIATVTPGTSTTTATVTAGKNAGETTITATANGVQKTCTVQVQGIVLKDEELTLRVGENHKLEYTIYGDSLKDNVTWTSSDENVVQVDQGYLFPVSVGEATVTAKINGTTYTDTIKITVEKATADVIRTSATTGSPLSFASLTYQLNTQSNKVLKKSLNYVSALSVPTKQGTLYYNYVSEGNTGDGVASGANYYVSPGNGQSGLSNITFVPKSDFEGTAVISYTGYASGTEFFQGTIEVTVDAPDDVTYSSGNGNVVQFDASDFAQACRQQTGNDLSYVTFSLPDASKGTLYENYLSESYPGNPVAVNTKYKYSGTPNLGDVYFLPAAGTSGTVTIPYTGYSVNGSSFRGRVSIRVSAATATGDVTYTVGQGGRVTFDDRDFNDLSRSLTGYSLDRVRFTLPPTSQGRLYYDYTSSSGGSLVSEEKYYYRSSSPYLDKVTFVADDDYAGTVSIPFTAWDIQGNRFSGQVGISVTTQSSGNVKYSMVQGKTVTFDDSDFNDLSLDLTGSSLNYVRFSPPSSSQGTLYYKYNSSSSYDSKVSESRSYYRSSSPRLDDVTFVGSSSFTGTATVDFTGWNTKGESFEGTVTITVTPAPQVGGITYTTAYNPVTFRAADFISACNQRGEGSLTSVQFTGADRVYGGRLYYRYNGIHSASSQVRSTALYYPSSTPSLSEISFVPWVGFQGTVSVSYTATDSKGETYQGTVRIQVTPNTTSRYFSDMGSASWAAAAVDFLYENGVVSGTGAGTYSPQAAITRGSFLVMLDQAFSFPGAGGQSFPDVPADAYYASAVQKAYALGIVAGYPDGSFHPNEAITREGAATILYQAMVATGWSIGSQDESVLYGYSDWQNVASYARGPMSVLVKNGLLSGNDKNQLNPKGTMSRAEMAVVLARAVTL